MDKFTFYLTGTGLTEDALMAALEQLVDAVTQAGGDRLRGEVTLSNGQQGVTWTHRPDGVDSTTPQE